MSGYLSSKHCDWITPPHILASARIVMGGIDLDPASSILANSCWVKASRFYDESSDGMKQEWSGTVWLNPPFGKMASQFVNKLHTHFSGGEVTQAILLLNQNSMSSAWFSSVYDECSVMMVTRGRLKFTTTNVSVNVSSPTTGHVIAYYGTRELAFAKEFSKHGHILTPWSKEFIYACTGASHA